MNRQAIVSITIAEGVTVTRIAYNVAVVVGQSFTTEAVAEKNGVYRFTRNGFGYRVNGDNVTVENAGTH